VDCSGRLEKASGNYPTFGYTFDRPLGSACHCVPAQKLESFSAERSRLAGAIP